VDNFDEIFEIEITDTLDLHAFAPQETKLAVLTFLDEAQKLGFRYIRIIHGKGIGVQKEIVRKILSESNLIESFKDTETWGATVAKIKLSGKTQSQSPVK
jgi:DNA-nicking Smr family endonuclease